MGKQSLINPVQVTEPAELISEEDVLRHYASVAQFQTHKRKYAHAPVPRQRIKRPKQENNIPISQQEDSIPKSQTLGEFASRNGGLEGQPNVSEPELSVSPTPQAEPSARSTSSVAVNFVSPRNILPPPPPLDDQLPDEPLPHTTSESDTLEEEAAGPSSSDPRPQWSFTTTPLPPHLQRQAQLRPSAAPSNVSEEDVSEVDEQERKAVGSRRKSVVASKEIVVQYTTGYTDRITKFSIDHMINGYAWPSDG
ncbi:hypothetical protein NliqN6_2532 [Naganishia liquefaciens]|uniref:Uncharacterized protein n=1 Tax=Naganishia liquefaciens TaxID=104408 RepID=A0A8H3TT19_9TREE|nr:hypothetical protein NliqN6_2532 [Naganishia liquefaciens]